MNIDKYLEKHLIIKFGSTLPQFAYYEIIVDKPEEFLLFLTNTENYISVIRWWEYTPISVSPRIGYGGKKDPSSPNKYFFAETDVYKNFDSNTEYKEYVSYLKEIRDMYSDILLLPAFNIERKPIRTCRDQSGDGSMIEP